MKYYLEKKQIDRLNIYLRLCNETQYYYNQFTTCPKRKTNQIINRKEFVSNILNKGYYRGNKKERDKLNFIEKSYQYYLKCLNEK
jgi:hypothetical protein